VGSRTYTVYREEDENGSANNRDMSRLLDVMTAMEMDDDPLILINPLRYATMACVDDKDGARGSLASSVSTAIYNLNARLTQSGTHGALFNASVDSDRRIT